jgi:hypothetical protein
MLPVPTAEVYAGLLLLLLAVLPLGCLLLRGAERWVGRRFALAVPERILVAFFAAGGLFFVIASFPSGLFSLDLVLGLLAAGVVGYVVVAVRESGAGVRSTVAFLRTAPGAALALGSLGLLALEVVGGQVLLPNGVDGTVYALFVNVLIAHGGVAWTLQPYATTGILYPQGAPVWMALPVLLFGWPIVAAPVVLPPLFLSFTAAAGYSLGERLRPLLGLPSPHAGLLFAAFFGLLASWPRFYVAGSYDFIFALPMFLVVLGFLFSYTERERRPWTEVVAFGVLLGGLSAISLAVGSALLLLLLVSVGVATWRRSHRSWTAELARFAAIAVVTLGFLARSFIAVVLWFNYPGHVLTHTGSPPYAPLATTVVYSGWTTQLDPFLPWKPKVSPIPLLYVVVEFLLLAGIGLIVLSLSGARRDADRPALNRFYQWLLAGIATLVIEISFLLAAVSADPSISGIQAFTNVWETSFLLFILYSLVALVPLVVALGRALPSPSVDRTSTTGISPRDAGRPRDRRRTIFLLVVVVPLALGTAGTIAYAPAYLHQAIVAEANATSGDVQALEWAGAHLPACSQVLVPPGSAAQFLPEYAPIHLVFPVYPSPTNRSYNYVVTNLTAGVYNVGTRAALTQLGITELFVTGATTNSYAPFQSAPLRASADFTVLFSEQDATIFEFVAGVESSGCAPT